MVEGFRESIIIYQILKNKIFTNETFTNYSIAAIHTYSIDKEGRGYRRFKANF